MYVQLHLQTKVAVIRCTENKILTFKYEAQTALFKDPLNTTQ